MHRTHSAIAFWISPSKTFIFMENFKWFYSVLFIFIQLKFVCLWKILPSDQKKKIQNNNIVEYMQIDDIVSSSYSLRTMAMSMYQNTPTASAVSSYTVPREEFTIVPPQYNAPIYEVCWFFVGIIYLCVLLVTIPLTVACGEQTNMEHIEKERKIKIERNRARVRENQLHICKLISLYSACI